MQALKNQFEKIMEVPFLYKLYASRYRDSGPLRLTYNVDDLTPEYYAKVKDLGWQEIEHQIGRLGNFKHIIRECAKLDGDFVEFGSWKGFSLLWIAYFMERNALLKRKLVGLDGFIGLPYTDGGFRLGKFANTSLKECRRNVLESKELYNETRKNVYIEKFLYREKAGMAKYLNNLQVKKFCFIHIDCDVSQSAKEIFDLLVDENLIADTAYILFDDFGLESALREEIKRFIKRLEPKWTIKEHSSTVLTKNFVFTKK